MKINQFNHRTASAMIALTAILIITPICSAVNSKTVTHSSASAFLKGETENTVIGSRGTISLAAQATDIDLGDLLKDAWIVNAIVKDSKGNIYIATSPNGDIIKYADGKAEKIYPATADKDADKDAEKKSTDDSKDADADDAEESADPNNTVADPNDTDVEPFLNLHIFAIAIDSAGRLIAGVSGDKCELIRFDNGNVETIFTSEEVSYILEITVDKAGNIFLGTGPNGQIYRLDPNGKHPKLVYDSTDNNILALAIDSNNFIYAGSDKRGIVYKIHPFDQSATVLYDSSQDEITDLTIDDKGNIYATATSAKSVGRQTRSAGISTGDKPGRPDTKKASKSKKTSDTKLEVANTGKSQSQSSSNPPQQSARGDMPKSASHIYRIDPRGFVTNVFNDKVVFFNMLMKDGQIILGTGNKAELVTINTQTEQKTIAYEDETASQITALAFDGDDILIGTSNPAKLVTLSDKFQTEGTYTSDLVDAGQPARWGKLQIDAELPEGCKILLAARSGNVDEPNDPTFSDWTEDTPVIDATQLECPIGRYCQYRLTLSTDDNKKTPLIDRIAVPHVIDNLAPKVTAVRTSRSKDSKQPATKQISFSAVDANRDTLSYKIEFRKISNTRWILLKDKLTQTKFDWKTNTVEDGRYEVRITVDDARSNTTSTALTSSRISDQIIVDNTPPAVDSHTVTVKGTTATLKLTLKDALSVVGNLSYTVNSNEDWKSTIPDDLIYDTTKEEFTIIIEDLEPGENVIAIRFNDDVKNTKYKSYEAKVE
ncbi:MAG: hypothetical protein FVQ82_01455 [Planctomycetes bacterium]|nr:hypothetical protein [Planctomycetota bacterium]